MGLLRHLFVGFVLAFILLPFLWMAYAAFLPKEAVYSGEIFQKLGFSLENLKALRGEGFWERLLFSLGLSGGGGGPSAPYRPSRRLRP